MATISELGIQIKAITQSVKEVTEQKKIFNSLQLNFDTTKFGNALDPMNNLTDKIVQSQAPLKKWQYDAVANNQTSKSLYMQNPLANTINEIISYANNMYVLCNTYSILANANTSSASLVNTCIDFLTHTDRVSGVQESTNSARPDFFTATGFGSMVFRLVSKYEGVGNNTPVLGSMTSLFTKDDLVTYSVILQAASIDLRNSLTSSGFPVVTYSSNLTSQRISEIVNSMNVANNFMSTRMNHDIKFFGNIKAVSNNIANISRFSGFTDLTAHLVDNYVGTDTLKNNL
jgi:hypothetical protein